MIDTTMRSGRNGVAAAASPPAISTTPAAPTATYAAYSAPSVTLQPPTPAALDGAASKAAAESLTTQQLLNVHYLLTLARALDDRMWAFNRQGKAHFVISCCGQEAAQVGSAMALQPGWHSTAFAPYFVIGAVHSGMAGVVTTMIVLRRLLGLHGYLRAEHLDALGRLQVVVALGYVFFVFTDFTFGLMSRDPVELNIWQMRLFGPPPTNLLFYLQLLLTLAIPFPLLFSRRIRRSFLAMFWLSISVNLGMWLERYLLVVNPLSDKQPFVFMWVSTYQPRLAEYLFTLGGVAAVALGVLLFAKLFPIVPLWEVKQGEVLSARLRVGRARLPAVMGETPVEEEG